MSDQIIKKLEAHDAQLELIARTVVDHTERLDRIEENMATKQDLGKITETLDDLVGLARKKDQELTFISHHLQRVDADVQKIKPLVGLT